MDRLKSLRPACPRVRPILCVALALALALPLAHASARTESRDYVGVTGDALALCAEESGLPSSIGGACFALDGTESVATIRAIDTSGRAVGLHVEVRSAASPLVIADGCHEVTIDLHPAQAFDELRVWVEDAGSPLHCPVVIDPPPWPVDPTPLPKLPGPIQPPTAIIPEGFRIPVPVVQQPTFGAPATKGTITAEFA